MSDEVSILAEKLFINGSNGRPWSNATPEERLFCKRNAQWLIDKGAWWVPEAVNMPMGAYDTVEVDEGDYRKMTSNRKEVFDGFLERS